MRIAQRTACADDFLSAHTVRSPHQRTQIRPWATFSCRLAGWWPALRRRCIDIFSNEAGLMKQLTIKALFWAMALASAFHIFISHFLTSFKKLDFLYFN
jgi:hypothetical protein